MGVGSDRRVRTKADRTPAELLERLEARTMLDSSALPDISALTNVNNTVVRFQLAWGTNRGDVDIELFDTQAPITVGNFLKYVRDGDFDKTFFHRYAKLQNGTPFVLQGGLARLKAPANTGTFRNVLDEVPTDAAIQNEFSSSRSNVARTLAMAKVGGQVNSATSQFFFNLGNNAANLDNQNGGFTVFARVVDDRSWNVIQSLTMLSTSNQGGQPYDELPISGTTFSGTNPNESELVTLVDAEVIKPQGVGDFFRYRYYFPEGFAGGGINEFLPMGNPGDVTATYQVIVRAETSQPRPTGNVDYWYRDKVIDRNTIAPRKRAGFTVSRFSSPQNNLVPLQGKAYAYEVWSTTPLAVTLSHYDFGSSTIESFLGGQRYSRDTINGNELAPVGGLAGDQSGTTWAIPDIRKAGGNRDFLVWQNASSSAANVTVKFFFDSAATPVELTFPTEAFRRGGLNINDLPQLPNGNISAIVTSDQPIIAGLTHYKTTGTDKGGATQAGIFGDGSRAGIIPLANVNADGSITDQVSIVNPGNSGAIVTLIATFDDATPDFTTTVVLAAGSRQTVNLGSFAALANKRFSLRYSSGITPIYASTLHIENTDVATNPLAITAAPVHDFGEGFINRNATDVFEQLGFYNPNEATLRGTDIPANITVKFGYTDGTVVTKTYVVAAGRRLEVILDQDSELRDQNTQGRFFYSINVVSDVPIIAMMRHYDLSLGGLQPSGGDSSIGTQRGTATIPVVRLDQLGMLPIRI